MKKNLCMALVLMSGGAGIQAVMDYPTSGAAGIQVLAEIPPDMTLGGSRGTWSPEAVEPSSELIGGSRGTWGPPLHLGPDERPPPPDVIIGGVWGTRDPLSFVRETFDKLYVGLQDLWPNAESRGRVLWLLQQITEHEQKVIESLQKQIVERQQQEDQRAQAQQEDPNEPLHEGGWKKQIAELAIPQPTGEDQRAMLPERGQLMKVGKRFLVR